MRVRGAFPMMWVAAALLLGTPDPVRAGVSVGVGVNIGGFHDSLAAYGTWTNHSRYGSVWAPRQVGVGWRPYTVGRWAYTDYDWTWVSDEPWGWATYHYGRWVFDPALGWIWIPGYEWAPAWVTWRFGGGYVGWAPLPPYANAFGFRGLVDPYAFSFVHQRYLAEPFVARHFLPVQRNVTIVNVTKNITNYTVVNNRIVNRGVSPREIERVSGRAVPRLKVREVASVPRPGQRASVTGRELTVFRPSIKRDPQVSQDFRQNPSADRPSSSTTQRPGSDREDQVRSTNPPSHVVNRGRADEPRASKPEGRVESRPGSSRDSFPSTNRSASDRNDQGRSTNPPSHVVNRGRADEPRVSRPESPFESRPRSSRDSFPSTNRPANPPSHVTSPRRADEPRVSRPDTRFESRPRSSNDSFPSTHRPSFESRRGDSRPGWNERPAARPAAPAHRAPTFQDYRQARPSERARPAPAPSRREAPQSRVDSGRSRSHSSADRPAQQRNAPSRNGRRPRGR